MTDEAPIIKIKCSGCRRNRPVDLFINASNPTKILKTCSTCRKPRTNNKKNAKLYRERLKAQGVILDKRGASRTAYMREYRQKKILEQTTQLTDSNGIIAPDEVK